ncbi:MAG TPA: hypothetical protein VJ827_08165 [Rubrobacter sp.]|nr:hypothetical protein [Rubrobacter sp.]
MQTLVHEENVRVLTGLETWFTLPSHPGEPAPQDGGRHVARGVPARDRDLRYLPAVLG